MTKKLLVSLLCTMNLYLYISYIVILSIFSCLLGCGVSIINVSICFFTIKINKGMSNAVARALTESGHGFEAVYRYLWRKACLGVSSL